MKVYTNLRASAAAVITVILVASVLSGCSHDATPVATAPPVPVASPILALPITSTPTRLVVYKLASRGKTQDANGLVAVTITKVSQDPMMTALNGLTGANSPLPSGTKILSAKVDNASHVATVDFSKELVSNFQGGETHESQAINSVLQTLGQFPNIQSVQFLVDGQKIDSLGGSVELDEPLPVPTNSVQVASTATPAPN